MRVALAALLCALAACRGMGIDCIELLPAISQLKGGSRRMERHEVGHVVLFDDTYNANPESARAAVRFLAGLHGKGRRVLVLGDMLELGESGPAAHRELGELLAGAPAPELIVLVGNLASLAAGVLARDPRREVMMLDGLTPARAAEIAALLRPGDIVLLKGSRRMGLERVLESVRAAHGATGRGVEMPPARAGWGRE